jgi:hypothetical protein
LNSAYANLLNHARTVLDRAFALEQGLLQGEEGTAAGSQIALLLSELAHWRLLTVRVCDTAYRRTQLGESVPNNDKLFSIFETHTQLYRRGKAGEPNQYGRLVLAFEDGEGFISHYHLMDREANDESVVAEQMRAAQKRHGGQIREASFDRNFYSDENAQELKTIVAEPCLPPQAKNAYAK